MTPSWLQPASSGKVTLSTLTPPSDEAIGDENAWVRAVSSDVPFSMTASLSAIDELGSNRVWYAWVTSAEASEAPVVVGEDGIVVVGSGTGGIVTGGGGVAPPEVTMTGATGGPVGATAVIPDASLLFG